MLMIDSDIHNKEGKNLIREFRYELHDGSGYTVSFWIKKNLKKMFKLEK